MSQGIIQSTNHQEPVQMKFYLVIQVVTMKYRDGDRAVDVVVEIKVQVEVED